MKPNDGNPVGRGAHVRWWIPGAALLSVAVIAATGCGGSGEEHPTSDGPNEPVTVSVAEATTVSWTEEYRLTAGIHAIRRATPGTVLMGTVQRVLHEEGDRVRKGEVLARVESREVRARLAQAEAAVTAARAMERNALLMKRRMERLHAKDAASQKNLDDAVAGYDAALANLKAAEEGVKAARMYVAYSKVTAPFSGVVSEKRIEVGDLAAPGMPLFVVEDLSRVKVEAQVPESAGAGLRPGDPVIVEVNAADTGRMRARISEVLPAADPQSRTFTIRAVLDNPGGRIRSGMFARLLLPGLAREVIAVPRSALVRQGPLTGIFVVDPEGVARLRWVTLGRAREDRVEVLTGLDAGERYVIEPPAGLEDGRPIEAR